MVRINHWQDLSLIEDDPELRREAYLKDLRNRGLADTELAIF